MVILPVVWGLVFARESHHHSEPALLLIRLTELEKSLLTCKNEKSGIGDKLSSCEKGSSDFLSKLIVIQKDIREFSPAIDFAWEADKKKEAAFRVLEILGRLGHYKNAPEPEPARAKEALIQYQKAKGILPMEEPKQGLLGRTTFLRFVTDYIQLEESGG